MTRPIIFAIPGDLDQPTGGYGYDRHVLAHAARRGVAMTHLQLPGGFPSPTREVLAETARLIAATPENAILMIDGLAYGAMPADLIEGFNRPVIDLCHHPLALEPGLRVFESARLHASESTAMAMARKVIVTAEHTKGIVSRAYKVPSEKIVVAVPGTDRAEHMHGSGLATPQLIAVGSVIPRKGYDVLVTALARLRDLDWSLRIVGSLTQAPQTATQVQKLIHDLDLGDRITLCGPMTETQLQRAYDTSDLFVMSSLFEGYGMVIAEAMARGLPIVATTGGAAGDTLDDRAGIKVQPGSAEALAEAIQTMLQHPEKRRAYADGSWAAGQTLPTWEDTLDTILAATKDAGA